MANTTKLDLMHCKVKDLKEAIKNLPDDLELDVYCTGETGFVDGLELEINEYENLNSTDVCFNVKAESGYHY